MMNRMNNLIPICHYDGKISMGDVEITGKDADLVKSGKNWDGFSKTKSVRQFMMILDTV